MCDVQFDFCTGYCRRVPAAPLHQGPNKATIPTQCFVVVLIDQAPTSISQLPLQLLAEVLQHVEPCERLDSCTLVCSTWHAAVIAATTSISTTLAYAAEKYSALHAWLLRHGLAAAVESLHVKGLGGSAIRQLQLPVQQLTALKQLQLEGLSVEFQQTAAHQQASTAALPRELSAVTYLGLHYCPLQLDALPAFTQLQHLGLTERRQRACPAWLQLLWRQPCPACST